MKTISTIFIFCAAGLCGLKLNAQLVAVIHEEVFTSPGAEFYPAEGYSTYRIYALLQDPTDRLGAVFGSTSPSPNHHLTLGSTVPNSIWNTNFGGFVGDQINPALLGFFPDVEWDSYITINKTSGADPGGQIFTISDPPNMVQGSFGSNGQLNEFLPNLLIMDGAWFIVNDGSVNGFGYGPNNSILLAQVTVPTGTLSYCLNISIFDEGIGANQLIYVHDQQDSPGMVGEFPEIDGSALGLCYDGTGGCTDPLACNYDDWATEENGTCLFGDECNGCTDFHAENYNPYVLFDDGSCTYSVNGNVFRDVNEDGFFNTADFYLEGISVNVLPENITGTTDINGHFEVSGLPQGNHTLEVILPAEYDGVSTVSSFDFSTNVYGDLFTIYQFGLISSEPVYDITLQNTPYYNWYYWYFLSCQVAFDRYYYITNNGNTTIEPVLNITYNDQLDLIASYPSWSAMTDGVVSIPLPAMLPGHSEWVSLVFGPPGVDLNGSVLVYDALLDVYDEGVWQISTDIATNAYVACSYDPNDKQVFPQGYTDQHFIEAGTTLDYVIHFQNTGSDTAEVVTVLDTLDVKLDLSTFELVDYSHNVSVSINDDTREVSFLFANIALPDSASGGAESNGFVIYRVTSFTDLQPGMVIENNAAIYFDSNDPIYTGTVFNTIFSCDELAMFDASTQEICAGEEVEFISSQPFIDEYFWLINDEAVSVESQFTYTFEEAGTFMVSLHTANPVCDDVGAVNIEVHANPDSFFTQVVNELTASDGEFFQWYVEGEIIEGATNQNLSISSNGNYSVEITNEFGCTALGEEVLVIYTAVNEIGDTEVVLFPNPMHESATLYFKGDIVKIQVLDLVGRIIRNYELFNAHQLTIQRENLAAGSYLLKMISENNVELLRLVME